MKTFIEELPAQPVVYMRRTGPYGEENRALMQAMKAWLHDRGLWCAGGVLYAVARDDPAVTPPKKCRYDVCYVTRRELADVAVRRGTLPAGRYLVCEIAHTSAAVGQFWEQVGTAAAAVGEQLDGSRPILERYPIALVEEGRCQFCLPVFARGPGDRG